MKRISFFIVFSALCFGQGGNMLMLKFPGAPSGTCAFLMQAINGSNGNLYYCPAGSWVLVTGGGGGGTPGGATNSVQYNAGGGTFGGITNLTTNGTNPLLTAIAAPASPSAGFGVFYEDSTSLNLVFKNASGTVNHGVQTANSVAHNFLTAIADNGSVSLAQPVCGDLSDSQSGCSNVAPANTTATSHQFFTAYTQSTGAFTKAQPVCGDLSDSASGCTNVAPANTASVSHQWLNSYTASTGAFGQTQPAFSDLSGSAACGQLPALTGDTTTSAGSCATTTAKINGTAFPTSAHVIGSNGSAQPTASTGHDVSAILTCVAASASGTAYTCSTSPTFTPASGDAVLFKADVANTGSATLAVNSAAAATIKKQGGGTNLVANDLLAGTWTPVQFDGTNWQMEGQVGNAAGGGSPGGSDTQWQYNNAGSFGGLVGTSSIPQTGWTVVNCGSNCVYNDFSSASQNFFVSDNSTLNWRLVERSLPASTYTVIFTIDCKVAIFNTSSVDCGVYLYDGTKLEGYELLSQNTPSCKLRVEHITNVTTDNSTAFGPTANLVGCTATLKIVNDGTHRTFYHWSSGSFTQDLQETTGTFLTETSFGFGGVSVSGTAAEFIQTTLQYLKATTP